MEEFEHTKEDGTIVKVVPSESAAATATELAETKAALDLANKDIGDLKRVSAEKTMNFQKFNELTDEQKKAYNENEINLLRRGDMLEEKLTEMTAKFETKEKTERDSTKTNALKSFHKGIADVQTKLEANYAALAGMPESTAEEIQARASQAAILSNIVVDSRNPLNIPIDGQPPRSRDQKEFVETPVGEAAADAVRQAMGLTDPNKKK